MFASRPSGRGHAVVMVVELHHANEELTDVFDALRTSENSSYALSSDLQLLEVNEGWRQFALRNNGAEILRDWVPGRLLLDAISEVLRPFFAAGYERALRTGLRWDHDYECNSAVELRKFRMIALPSRTTLVVTHSPLVELPMDRPISEGTADYVSNGFIVMCSHCRRTRNVMHQRWDWVPSFIARMPDNVSHGLCPACVRYYAEW